MRQAWIGPRSRRALWPLVPMFLAAAALWPLAQPIEGVGDAFQFWFAGHLVATGRSPYDQTAWAAAGSTYGPPAANVAEACVDPGSAACAWVYPPAAGWLFAPFGAADARPGVLGVDAFVVLTAFGGVVATVLLFGPTSAGPRGVLLVTAVVSHPFVYDIHVGHFAGLELLGVVGITQGLRGRAAWPLVLGAVTLSLTPHLFPVLAAVVLVVLVARRRWRAIAFVGAALLAVLTAGAVVQPEAFSAILGRAGGKTALTWSTSWALAQLIAPAAPVIVLGVLIGLAGLAAIAVVRTAPREDRDLTLVATGTALSLVVTPYAQPYDLLLLLPALALAARGAVRAAAWPRSAILAALPLVFVVGTWFPLAAARIWEDGNRSLGLVPVLVLVVAAAAFAAARCPLAGVRVA